MIDEKTNSVRDLHEQEGKNILRQFNFQKCMAVEYLS